MSRYLTMRVLIAAAVALIAAAVWAAGSVQQSAGDRSSRAADAGRALLVAMLDQETGLRGYATTARREFLAPYYRGRADLETALADAQAALARADARDGALLMRQATTAERWQRLAQDGVDRVERRGPGTDLRDAERRRVLMVSFRRANARFTRGLEADARAAEDRARIVSVAIVLGLGAAFGLFGWLFVERPTRREGLARARLAEFSDAMQVTRSEHEAYSVLRRHLERWLDDAGAWVFTRNASANRLQAATPVESGSQLARPLDDAAPESCLAIRLAKPHRRSPDAEPLMACTICGRLPGHSTCFPSIVGGEVVGSVLVETPKPVRGADLADVTATVTGAGPVIANLRNLSIAELRAATDVLTGLPNQRAVSETLQRMAAQAARTKTPLAAVVLDLDRFKQVNDVYGHAKGDEVLSSVGAVLRDEIRESDFAGRYGGEEFVLLLPDTDGPGAITAAEKLRTAIERLQVPGLEGRVSASFGIAVLPTHAHDADQLIRAADRALYAAKNAGRNRVEVVETG